MAPPTISGIISGGALGAQPPAAFGGGGAPTRQPKIIAQPVAGYLPPNTTIPQS